jgi:hypothetical protein
VKIYSINNMDYIILVQAIGGVLFVPKITQWLCNTLPRGFQKSYGLHHISFETWKGIA